MELNHDDIIVCQLALQRHVAETQEALAREAYEHIDPNDEMVVLIIADQLEAALEAGIFDTRQATKGQGFFLYAISSGLLSSFEAGLDDAGYLCLRAIYLQVADEYLADYWDAVPAEYHAENQHRLDAMAQQHASFLIQCDGRRGLPPEAL